DWQPMDAVKLHWRSTYSTFNDNEFRDQFRLEIGTAITGQTSTTGNLNTRGTRFIRRREEDDKTFTTNVGAVFEIGTGTGDAGRPLCTRREESPVPQRIPVPPRHPRHRRVLRRVAEPLYRGAQRRRLHPGAVHGQQRQLRPPHRGGQALPGGGEL